MNFAFPIGLAIVIVGLYLHGRSRSRKQSAAQEAAIAKLPVKDVDNANGDTAHTPR